MSWSPLRTRLRIWSRSVIFGTFFPDSCFRAPAIVNPRSYNSSLIRRTFSMSFFLYTRCPAFDFWGAKFGNSVSQKRRTYGSTPTISQTSEILKKSLFGISRMRMHSRRLRTLLDYNRRPWEWKSLPDPVLDKSFERKVQLLNLIRKHDECRRVDLNLRNVANLDIRGQSASKQDLLSEKLIQIARRNSDETRFMHFVDCSI